MGKKGGCCSNQQINATKKGNRSNAGLTRKTMNINLPRPHLVMVVWFKMNSTPNAVETNTKKTTTVHTTVQIKLDELATVIICRGWQDGKPLNNSDPDCWLRIGAPAPDRVALIKNRHWYRDDGGAWSGAVEGNQKGDNKHTHHRHTCRVVHFLVSLPTRTSYRGGPVDRNTQRAGSCCSGYQRSESYRYQGWLVTTLCVVQLQRLFCVIVVSFSILSTVCGAVGWASRRCTPVRQEEEQGLGYFLFLFPPDHVCCFDWFC